MRSCRPALLVFPYIILLCACLACNSESGWRALKQEELQEWACPEYSISPDRMWHAIETAASAHTGDGMYTDGFVRRYYGQHDAPLVWMTREGVTDQADTLLAFLNNVGEIGLSPATFHTDTLQRLLTRIRNIDYTDTDASAVLGQTEFLLTQAFVRYACGQRYGFIHPGHVFNHLLEDEPTGNSSTVVYRQLFDMGNEEPTDSFVHHALQQVRSRHTGDFLREVEPTDALYQLMHAEYLRARNAGDTTRTRTSRINMERARWRYPRPTDGRYIWVNLAAQELTAVNTERDTTATMRVCCGNWKHKTPLLHSTIHHVGLNPYWVIPQTIVRKEIVPSHTGDSAYFARNGYRAINKETKEEVDPASLTASDLRSARYTLRQERGQGNSLGRIIFRFPNNFSVYLHDTNNHSAFQRANRAISHGCVRVQRPLDLALFFLDDPKPLFTDRIRLAIDLPPLTPEGRIYEASHPDASSLSGFTYDRPVLVWLDYWTLYPTPDNVLQAYGDPYGYDKVIEKHLR